jgi:hypothetical protein
VPRCNASKLYVLVAIYTLLQIFTISESTFIIYRPGARGFAPREIFITESNILPNPLERRVYK